MYILKEAYTLYKKTNNTKINTFKKHVNTQRNIKKQTTYK
jgi:hypothetical protein